MRCNGIRWVQAIGSVSSTAVKAAVVAVGILTSLLLTDLACSPNKPNAATLMRPIWECPSPPSAEIEKGTSGGPYDDRVHLRWIIGEDPDLEGYYIHRRKSTDLIDTLFATVYLTETQKTKRGTTLEWLDPDSRVGEFYHYVLFAFDRKSGRSARSDTLGYGILEKPLAYGPVTNQVVADTRPMFQFGPRSTAPNVQSYVVRVISDSAVSRVLWVSPRLPPGGYTAGERTTIQYGNGGFIRRAYLQPGKYRWRVDFQGSYAFVTADAQCGCVFDTSMCQGASSSLPRPEDLSFVTSQSAWIPFTIAQ